MNIHEYSDEYSAELNIRLTESQPRCVLRCPSGEHVVGGACAPIVCAEREVLMADARLCVCAAGSHLTHTLNV